MRVARSLCATGVALALALVAHTDATPQGRPVKPAAIATDGEAPLPRTARAVQAEADIARTDLGRRMEAALAGAFGGVWFEPATAQVHVGVTSAASRQLAETVAARAGLPGIVTEVPVASTWDQLDAAQARWDRRLADLFDRAKVATALRPDRNAVSIELASSVSRFKRAALERVAAADSVAVEISVVPQQYLRVASQAQCKAFKKNEAYCDETIVGGVTIKGPPVTPVEEVEEGEEDLREAEFEELEGGKKRSICSAGPAVILKNAVSKADKTKTFILTAGHCINPDENGGGVNGKWIAYDKEGTPREIGEARAFSMAKIDVGLIEVNLDYWAKPKEGVPLIPKVANWSGVGETEAVKVIEQKNPLLNTKTCRSGQTTGTSCGGEIVTIDQTITAGGVTTENLIEAKGIAIEKGDSGGPWFAEAQFNQTPKAGYVEGTTVGRKIATKNPVFHSLQTSLAKLKSEKGYDLELLTDSNKARHRSFTGAKYPVTTSAEDSVNDQFTAFGVAVTCKKRSFDGELAEPETEEIVDTVELTPSYSECADDEGRALKIDVNDCKFRIVLSEKVAQDHYKAEVSLDCPEGKPGLEFEFYASHEDFTNETYPCEVTIPPQDELESLTLTNSDGKIVVDKGTVEGIKAQIERNDCFCPGSGDKDETTAAIYHIAEALTVSGEASEEEVEIDMTGS